ncbi:MULTISPECIES: hypothetical protein [Ruminococcus]|uniref:Dockerin domain-containing protein n=1 Tax=Ruminococcus flavefaciens TaxID=1265 RepID=A0A1M7J226_RUMFL|nr:hypothetical protein [Ruminococcus sp.]SHM47066.1 hypothetical protein SAMN04487860_10589 [Ruminococcus flavefaciens]
MNIKKSLAAILSCAMAIGSQTPVFANAAVKEPSIIVAIGIDPPGPNAEPQPSSGIILPRVQLEYECAEVVDASYEVLTLDDGKKLYIDSGEKKRYTGMFQKGNKISIKGEFAYSESQDLYLNCTADIKLVQSETKENKELDEKLAELPHIEIGHFGTYVMEADKDTIIVDNGMKFFVSSGLQNYTDMFKKNNCISIEGEFAYDKDTDMFYNVDSYMGICDYVVGYNVYGGYEDENGNWVEEEEIVTTTTNVNDITTCATTTTTTAAEYRYSLGGSQPEGKYPIHFYDYALYKFEREVTVKEIDSFIIVADDGTRWSFSTADHDTYELGRGDVIKVSGYFHYFSGIDAFGAFTGDYEIVSESNDYEKYAEIEIQKDFSKRKIIDKRLSADFNIQYAPELEDVQIIGIEYDDIFTVEGGYKFAFRTDNPGYKDLKIGTHIKISGWYEYDSYFGWYSATDYHNTEEEAGKFTILSQPSKGEAVDTSEFKPLKNTPNDIALDIPQEVSTLKGDANIDGGKDLSDTVIIMQSLANPNKYQLSEQGQINADVYGDNDGVTMNDALAIQISLLYNE